MLKAALPLLHTAERYGPIGTNTKQSGGPKTFWDHPLCRTTLLFISSSTLNPAENGTFNKSGVGKSCVVAAPLVQTYSLDPAFEQSFQ